jgi:hypothetical protein
MLITTTRKGRGINVASAITARALFGGQVVVQSCCAAVRHGGMRGRRTILVRLITPYTFVDTFQASQLEGSSGSSAAKPVGLAEFGANVEGFAGKTFAFGLGWGCSTGATSTLGSSRDFCCFLGTLTVVQPDSSSLSFMALAT